MILITCKYVYLLSLKLVVILIVCFYLNHLQDNKNHYVLEQFHLLCIIKYEAGNCEVQCREKVIFLKNVRCIFKIGKQ